MLRLNCLYPIYFTDEAIGHIFYSLVKHWQTPQIQAQLVVPSSGMPQTPPFVRQAIPRWLRWYHYRKPHGPRTVSGKKFLRDMPKFDAGFAWVDSPIEVLRGVKNLGKPLILERINCHPAKARQILDEEYARLGAPPQHKITDAGIANETDEMALADYVFCPSAEVHKSFLEAGVPERKLLLSSYGWSPQRFPNRLHRKPPSDDFSLLFVGYVCVRKGAHLLLQAWEKAGIKGTLTLCGRMEGLIAERFKHILARPDVKHHTYNPDVSSAFATADAFAFPSLEEGSPLVTYEAMAHGLPIVTSPMGAGGVLRNQDDGIVIDPHDEDALIQSLRTLATSPDLRQTLGRSAITRAEEFTWDKVAARRADMLVARCGA